MTDTEKQIKRKVAAWVHKHLCRGCDKRAGFIVDDPLHELTRVGNHFDFQVRCRACGERRIVRWYKGEISFIG